MPGIRALYHFAASPAFGLEFCFQTVVKGADVLGFGGYDIAVAVSIAAGEYGTNARTFFG